MKNKDCIEIETKKGTVTMTLEEFSRWACLLELVTHVQKFSETKNINLDKFNWIKPLKMQEYIEQRFHSMLHDVKVEHARGLI